ncbi:Uncharacterised protein [Escherichia coli]|uniref:Uncharacterized protein n=1 Tax=Escherichia coli TaxID=562 RepID=A0A376DLB0_ECOLX|nr:Uncharacterised protein [Escherichia coli]
MLLQLASIGLNSLCIFSNPAVNATNCIINTGLFCQTEQRDHH